MFWRKRFKTISGGGETDMQKTLHETFLFKCMCCSVVCTIIADGHVKFRIKSKNDCVGHARPKKLEMKVRSVYSRGHIPPPMIR